MNKGGIKNMQVQAAQISSHNSKNTNSKDNIRKQIYDSNMII